MSPENIYNWILFINSVPLPTAHTNPVTQNPPRLFFFTLTLKPRRFLLHRGRLCEKKLHQEMLTLKHSWLGVSGRGVSSSTSVWAASSSLRCQGPSQTRAHRVPPCSGRPKEWTRQPPCQEFKGDYFPPCLLRLVILKYLVSIKYKNHMLFKSRSCSFVYWKGHCGYYYCPQKGPFWGDFCLLPAPLHLAPAAPASFVLPSRSLTPKWFISCNPPTRALLTKTIRNRFQAQIMLTAQTGTFPHTHTSQLTAKRTLISSCFDKHWAVGPWPHCAEEAKRHLAPQHLQVLPPLQQEGSPIVQGSH